MNIDELFTRSVALLPGPVRDRLDGDSPLEWTVLEDAGTGAELGEAVRARRRRRNVRQRRVGQRRARVRASGKIDGAPASAEDRRALDACLVVYARVP